VLSIFWLLSLHEDLFLTEAALLCDLPSPSLIGETIRKVHPEEGSGQRA
jgi:hypothetical protein